MAGGEIKGTKTETTRTVRLLTPLAADLREWRMRSGRPNDAEWIFPPALSGWRKAGYDNWRRRRWAPALKTAGLTYSRPYDLRHSFASLLVAEGRNVFYVAAQLGHGPEQTLRTYGHVIAEYEHHVKIDAEAEIRAAKSGGGGPSVAHRA